MPMIDKNTFSPKYFKKYFTKQLTIACGVVAISTFNYAFDQQGFNSTQAMDAFDKQFGSWNEKDQAYELDTYYLSLLNSLVYIGFAAGMLSLLWVPFTYMLIAHRRLDWQYYQLTLWTTDDYLLHVLVGLVYCNNSCHLRC